MKLNQSLLHRIADRACFLAILLLGFLLSHCSGPPNSPQEEVEIAYTPIPGGGFNDAGVASIYPNYPEYAFDNTWTFPPGYGLNFDDVCALQGSCIAGGNVGQFGDLISPQNSNAIPNDDGSPSVEFAVVTTQDLLTDAENISVTRSGIQTPDFAVPSQGNLRLKFDYAFLSGERDTGPSHNDFALVSLVAVDNAQNAVTVLRVDRDMLQAGGSGALTPLARSLPNGCGKHTIANVESTYSLCTGWQVVSFDLSPFRGKNINLRFTVEEVGGNNDKPVALAFDNVRIAQVELR